MAAKFTVRFPAPATLLEEGKGNAGEDGVTLRFGPYMGVLLHECFAHDVPVWEALNAWLRLATPPRGEGQRQKLVEEVLGWLWDNARAEDTARFADLLVNPKTDA